VLKYLFVSDGGGNNGEWTEEEKILIHPFNRSVVNDG